jgi:hypothetical protein
VKGPTALGRRSIVAFGVAASLFLFAIVNRQQPLAGFVVGGATDFGHELPSLPPSPSTAVATLEPVTIPLLLEDPHEAYIEVLHRPDRTLVSVLELLSPTSKEYPGRIEYLAKRQALLNQEVHLVKLELLLDGQRLRMRKPLLPADYCYIVSAAATRLPGLFLDIAAAAAKTPGSVACSRCGRVDRLAQVLATAYERGRFRKRIATRPSLYRLGQVTRPGAGQRAWSGVHLECGRWSEGS